LTIDALEVEEKQYGGADSQNDLDYMYFDFARLQILQLRPSKNPVDLFGVKSGFEQLVALLENLTGLDLWKAMVSKKHM